MGLGAKQRGSEAEVGAGAGIQEPVVVQATRARGRRTATEWRVLHPD